MKFTTIEIDQYIQGTLPKEKYDLFIKTIQNDSEFANEVDFYKKLNSNIRKSGREELRAELDIIHENKIQNNDPDSGKPSKKVWLWFLIATILLTIIGYCSIKFTENSSSASALYANYFNPYEFNAGTRTNIGKEDLLQLDELYSSQKYKQVIPLMNQYLLDNTDNNHVQLALANSYLETQKYSLALQALEALEAKNDVFLHGQVIWYKALCLLQLKDYKACLKTLQQIANNPGSDHYKQALNLIEKVDRLNPQ